MLSMVLRLLVMLCVFVKIVIKLVGNILCGCYGLIGELKMVKL